MLRVAFQFLAGRYHASPWGRHVNEGDVEWPPSPWRVLRALLATGFARQGWTDVPAIAERLIDKLASTTPLYRLPPASLGHTRHYLPQYKGTVAKVIDAFAWVGRDEQDVLGIEWQVELTTEEIGLLDALLGTLGYLGRAESWVEAQRVDLFPDDLICCETSEGPPGRGYQRVPLLAPLDAAAFVSFRRQSIDMEAARVLAEEIDTSKAKKKPLPKTLSKKALATVNKVVPETLVRALMADTNELQNAGWNQPPGSRYLSYWRPEHAISTIPVVTRGVARRRADTALFAVTSDTVRREVLPRLQNALPRLEQLHGALVKQSDRGDGPSMCLSGRDNYGAPLVGHAHALLLPLSLNQDERMDHVLVHARMGFDENAHLAVRKVRKVYGSKTPDLYLTLVSTGNVEDFVSRVQALQSSRVWTSVMPFVPPRYLKERGSNSLEGQVQAELSAWGLPCAERIEVELDGSRWMPAADTWQLWRRRTALVEMSQQRAGEDANVMAIERLATRFRHYRRQRLNGPAAALDAAFGLRLTFGEEVSGPIALGYAAHFGMGLFLPNV